MALERMVQGSCRIGVLVDGDPFRDTPVLNMDWVQFFLYVVLVSEASQTNVYSL